MAVLFTKPSAELFPALANTTPVGTKKIRKAVNGRKVSERNSSGSRQSSSLVNNAVSLK